MLKNNFVEIWSLWNNIICKRNVVFIIRPFSHISFDFQVVVELFESISNLNQWSKLTSDFQIIKLLPEDWDDSALRRPSATNRIIPQDPKFRPCSYHHPTTQVEASDYDFWYLLF